MMSQHGMVTEAEQSVNVEFKCVIICTDTQVYNVEVCLENENGKRAHPLVLQVALAFPECVRTLIKKHNYSFSTMTLVVKRWSTVECRTR